MRRRIVVGVLVAGTGLGAVAYVGTLPASAAKRPNFPGASFATLDGAAEVGSDGRPGAGDPDGWGGAVVTVKGEQVCFGMTVKPDRYTGRSAHPRGAPVTERPGGRDAGCTDERRSGGFQWLHDRRRRPGGEDPRTGARLLRERTHRGLPRGGDTRSAVPAERAIASWDDGRNDRGWVTDRRPPVAGIRDLCAISVIGRCRARTDLP